MKDSITEAARINDAIEWQLRRIYRALNVIKKLEDKKKRIARKAAAPKPPQPAPEPIKPADPLAIPGFLQRTTATEADAKAAQAIADERADLKLRKTRGRIAKLKAQKSGETRKMPLSGKAALAAIRSDDISWSEMTGADLRK